MEYACVLFDLDGTLLDTSTGILNAVNDTICHFHLSELDDAQLNVFMGCSIYDAFHQYFPEKDTGELVTYFRKMYAEKHFEEAQEYGGIGEVLAQIHHSGKKIGVATFKREDLAERLLSKYSFSQYIDTICGSDAEGRLRKPDIIKRCFSILGERNNDTVIMVGDAKNDCNAAKELSIKFLGVSYGYGFVKRNIYDFPMAHTPYEIINYIK